MSFLKEIRDAATALPLTDPRRVTLLTYADEINKYVRYLHEQPNTGAMQRLNALWVRATNLLEDIVRSQPTPPTGGAIEQQERLAA